MRLQARWTGQRQSRGTGKTQKTKKKVDTNSVHGLGKVGTQKTREIVRTQTHTNLNTHQLLQENIKTLEKKR